MNLLRTGPLIFIFLMLASQAASSILHYSPGGEQTHMSFEVVCVGRLSTVHRDGDASPHIRLSEVAGSRGFQAIGPLAGLRGEITVLDGVPFVTRVENNEIQVRHDTGGVMAPFLVYAEVREWETLPVDASVQSIASLEQWLATVAETKGIADVAFPFKVTTADSIAAFTKVDFGPRSFTGPSSSSTKPAIA